MPIVISCPCGKKLRVKEDHAGRKIKCPGCATVLSVPKPAAAKNAAPPREVKPARKNKARLAYWIEPTSLDSLIALDDEALFVACLNNKQLELATQALEDGQTAWTVLGKQARVIEFDDMKKVETNLRTTFLEVTWKSSDAWKETETHIDCASLKARDEILAALHERLGEDCDDKTVAFGRLRAAALPLYIGGILLFLCFCLYMIATGRDRGGNGGGGVGGLPELIFSILLNVVGPTGTLIVAAVATVLCLVWLFLRVKSPPIVRTLKPRR